MENGNLPVWIRTATVVVSVRVESGKRKMLVKYPAFVPLWMRTATVVVSVTVESGQVPVGCAQQQLSCKS